MPDFFNLYELEDTIVITPNDRKQCIVIDRNSQTFKFMESSEFIPIETQPHTFNVLWGIINLVSGFYLIIGDDVEYVGEMNGHKIFKIIQSSLVRIAKSIRTMSNEQFYDERAYVSMLQLIISTPGFYYSNTFDLTRSLQTQVDDRSKTNSLFSHCSTEYAWNGALLNAFLERFSLKPDTPSPILDFCCPIIHGFIELLPNLTSSKENTSTYALISRRSIHRPGTRFNRRGVDHAGNASNFVQTEQILSVPGNLFSFVQLRGSIPLIWEQSPTLKYTPVITMPGVTSVGDPTDPRPEFEIDDSQKSVCRRHFDKTVHMNGFGRNVCINLVNQTGRERILERTFAQAVKDINPSDVKYESFDFHKECGQTRWNRLNSLLERLEPEFGKIRYYHCAYPKDPESGGSRSVLLKQQGLFRTNCVDCLDRTNVVQSMIAKRILHRWIADSGLGAQLTIREDGSADLDSIWPNFDFKFRNLWADHADYISIQYSGTPALKTDFTRTGKRTLLGQLNDGYNSIKRYYLNNFFDGTRQDAMNLLLGHFSTVDQQGVLRPRPKGRGLPIFKRLLPPLFVVTLSMLFYTVAITPERWDSKLNQIMLWGTASAVSLFSIFVFGKDFVNAPLLDGEEDSGASGYSFRG